MFLWKWGICTFFWSGLLFLGQPIRANCNVSPEETQSTAANECRVHVEKALEEYWYKKEPSQDPNSNPVHRYSGPIKEETNLNDLEGTITSKDTRNDEKTADLKTNNEQKVLTAESLQFAEKLEQVEDLRQPNQEPQTEVQEETMKSDMHTENAKISYQSNAARESIKDAEIEKKEDETNHKLNDKIDNEINSSTYGSNMDKTIEAHVLHHISDKKALDDKVASIENIAKKVPKMESSKKDKKGIEAAIKTQSIREQPEEDESEEDEYDPCADVEDEEDETDDTVLDNDIGKEVSDSDALSGEILDIKEENPVPLGIRTLEVNATKEEPESSPVVKKTENLNILPSRHNVEKQIISNAEKPEFENDKNQSEELTYIEDDESQPNVYRSREHVDILLGLEESGSELEKEEEKLTLSIFKDIKKIESTHIKTIEQLYKYTDSTTRTLGDAEIFNIPMLLFIGPWSAGKTSIINYILGVERTPVALKTGTGITDTDFTILSYGNQRRILSGTELSADWRYAGLQKFGQGFLEHFRSIQIPHPLLRKVNIVDTPGIQENKKNIERSYSLNAVFQWFIDRADGIYIVLDPTKVDIGAELGTVIGQLKGRDVRFILNKADTIQRSDLIRVVGQLFWNLSPLMLSTEAPIIYAVSLTTQPFQSHAPAKFLEDQEKNLLTDMNTTLDRRVENRILYARKHAVLVRNHAKLVDCYLSSYYWHKSIFKNKRTVAKSIVENPQKYNIYEGLSNMANMSKYDLPNSLQYQEFFQMHPLYDFKPLASTCSYFRGCPMEKLDLAIAKEFPELLAKYKKAKLALDTLPLN